MIIFFSSDPCFKDLYEQLSKAGYSIELLITEPPKPKGRNLKITKNPAHLFAHKKGIKIFSPKKIDDRVISEFKKRKLKLGILYAYGKILPQKLLDLFEYGIINLHPSLLPQYRGPSPIQTAILNNDSETGYSFIKLSSKMDAGKIIFQDKIKIEPNDNFISLKNKIIFQASRKLPKVIDKYLSGEIIPKKQEGKVSYCKKINKEDGYITKKDTAISAYNKYRAFINWPGARIITKQTPIIIKEAKLVNKKLKLIKIQIPGKKVISFESFKNGYPKLLTELPDFVNI